MGLGIERFAGGALDQIAGEIAPAVGVDILAQPLEQGLVIAPVQGGLKIRQIPVGGLPELGAGEVSQGIGGEVAKAAQRPVDVLKAALESSGTFRPRSF